MFRYPSKFPQYIEDLQKSIDYILKSLRRPSYGSFYDTFTQTTAGSVQEPMKLRSTDISKGVSVKDDTKMVVSMNGVYDLQFSAQIKKISGGSPAIVYIWFKLNGVTIPESATALTMTNNNDFAVAAWNVYLTMKSGDYVQIIWYAPSGVEIEYVSPSGVIPGVPSVIATMSKVN